MNFFQGDIVTVPFPFSDQSGSKQRPAIVISNSQVNKTKDVILAAITSEPKHDEFTFEIKDAHVTYSLQKYSEIRCNKLFTAEKSLVQRKISKLKPGMYRPIFEKINALLREETN